MDLELAIWLGVAVVIVLALARRDGRERDGLAWLDVLFFVSGAPALIYQIAWQRALFEIYGVNVESVTVVVTAFMLGLGLGSLLGGRLSRVSGLSPLLLFAAAELGVAAFGFSSLSLFHGVARFTAGASLAKTGAAALLLLLLPTLLMGCTLPLLVHHVVRTRRTVGEAVGRLYFVNTLGSALACFVAAGGLMRLHGLSGAVRVAAVLNVCVGLSVPLLFARGRLPAPAPPDVGTPPPAGRASLPLAAALVLSAGSGFVALGCELLWYRFISFATGGLARSFAQLLGAYLAGIAVGSLAAERLAAPFLRRESYPRTIGLLVIAGNVLAFLVGPVLAVTVGWASLAGALPLVTLAAAALGATFPLVAHAAIAPDGRVGSRLSYLYVANVVGSTAGSAVVGFVALERWPASAVAAGLAILGVSIGATLLLSAEARWAGRTRVVAACVLCMVALAGFSSRAFSRFYERLQFKERWSGAPLREVIENRHGVITVDEDGIVYGGGAYEGRFTIDLDAPNGIVRAFAPAGFHPAPRRVLMIGLGTGSMAQIVVNHPGVERLTIVEINPGYVGLVSRTPLVASVTRNPKVELVVDDARRWLAANPERKFDLVFMNTPFHYRAHVSALLSEEFLQTIRSHLLPGGIHYFNTTQSRDAVFTAARVFPHRLRVLSFLAVSDAPILLDAERWRDVMLRYRIDGRPVIDPANPDDTLRLQRILAMVPGAGPPDPRVESGERFGELRGVKAITDDNMGAEWTR